MSDFAMFRAVAGALVVMLALSARHASAGPLNANPPPPKIPQIGNVDRSVAAGQQQQSFWGVQTVIQHKRDRLHGASGGEVHSKISN
jgi:hypothetical protein